jgi:hypothetical protein
LFDPGDDDSCARCVGPALRGEDAPRRRDVEVAQAPLDEVIADVEAQRAAEEAS